ncbi:hypothetical protein [Desulfosporosinus sp. SB140]|uniref:hypothetical protein n=1 Tax=Desulfosporosinus paludis TaxID=3115649 RepID=UPI00388D99D1
MKDLFQIRFYLAAQVATQAPAPTPAPTTTGTTAGTPSLNDVLGILPKFVIPISSESFSFLKELTLL